MASETKILVAEGDSWFFHPKFPGDIMDRFDPGNYQDFDYDVRNAAYHSDTLSDMVYETRQRRKVKEILKRIRKTGEVPVAVVISAGGNDIIGMLHLLVNDKQAGRGILNKSFAREFIRKCLYQLCKDLVKYITKECIAQFDKKIPILFHGYAYAVPDGRGNVLDKEGWIYPVLERKGHYNLQANTEAVSKLIDIFNEMLEHLSAKFTHVGYINLRPIVSNQLDEDAYREDWRDEIHLTLKGMRKVAAAIHAKIQNLK